MLRLNWNNFERPLRVGKGQLLRHKLGEEMMLAW